MKLYGLVHNNRIVVGPRSWNRAFFKKYVQDNNLEEISWPIGYDGDAIITNEWKILPVTMYMPNIDTTYEEHVGPFWVIHDTYISGSYTKQDLNINVVKGRLKEKVAELRYKVETGPLDFTFADSETVSIYTDRNERMIYLNTLNALPDGASVPFKFRNGKFRGNVSKDELSQIVLAGMNHISNAFKWEFDKNTEIDSATTLEELKLIQTNHPDLPAPNESNFGSSK